MPWDEPNRMNERVRFIGCTWKTWSLSAACVSDLERVTRLATSGFYVTSRMGSRFSKIALAHLCRVPTLSRTT